MRAYYIGNAAMELCLTKLRIKGLHSAANILDVGCTHFGVDRQCQRALRKQFAHWKVPFFVTQIRKAGLQM